MNTKRTQFTLTNKTNNPTVAHIIELLGPTVTITINPDSDMDDEVELESGYTNNLMILDEGGENNIWVTVIKIEMMDDHLILTACFGDEGQFLYCVTTDSWSNKPDNINKLHSNCIGSMMLLNT